MDQQRWQDIKRVFGEAVELAPAHRAAFIGGACGSDPELQAEVERLLRQHDAGAGFLPTHESTPGPAPIDGVSHPDAYTGRRIGPFEVLQVIGAGGMGMVFLARQERPRRTVALKVIRPGIVTSALLRRFDHEAQVLGRLQHPGIAQIFEAGTADTGSGPQPYFAMELVEGKPLLEHATSAALDVRSRLALFVLICDAVQHAHQKGVIHRDLKPANILVSTLVASSIISTAGTRATLGLTTAQPKILDFGVARVTDSDIQATTMRTDVGQLIGTLPYMSPEQVLGVPGEVDMRSDVYALGVVLYELLTDRLPYPVKERSIAEAARIIREAEPTPAGSVSRALRGDIDTILAKTLEKDKTRRYQTAADLAADLRRYLASEPIAARPPSTIYQLRTFARRNRTLVGVVAAAFIALLLGVAGTTWQAVAAIHQRDRARAEADKAAAINTFLRDLLAQADPISAKGKTLTVRDALDRASAKIASSFAGKPEIEGAVRNTIGYTYYTLGIYDQAQVHMERALTLVRDSVGPDHPEAIDLLGNLSLVYKEFNRLDDVEALLSEALERSRRVHGSEHPATLSAMNNMGKLLAARGKYADATKLLREAVEIRTRVLGPEDRKTLISTDNLAMALQQDRQYAQAEELFRSVHDRFERTLGPDDPDTIVSMHCVGTVLLDQGKLDEAERTLRRVVADRERVEGPNHLRTGSSTLYLARVLLEQGRAPEAEPLCRRALEMARASLSDDSVVAATWRGDLGRCLLLQGKYPEAEEVLLKSLKDLQAAPTPQSVQIRRTTGFLRDLYTRQGRTEEATKYQALLAESPGSKK